MKRHTILGLLLSSCILLNAQVSRDQAIETVVNEIIGPSNLTNNNLYSRFTQLPEQDTLWLDSYFYFLQGTYAMNWVFFIDPSPVVHWAHPCQYVFVDCESGNYTLADHMWPPHPFLYDYTLFLQEWEWVLTIGTDGPEEVEGRHFISPNPASTYIQINTAQFHSGVTRLTILDCRGMVQLEDEIAGNSTHHLRISIDKLSPGMHLVILRSVHERMLTGKFVKQ